MDLDRSQSRAILIGNGAYQPDSGIPNLPAAASSVAAMAGLLTGDLCRWPEERIVCLVDIASPAQLARQMISAVRSVQDTVLVYYVGHGLRTFEGQLALALSDTDADAELLPHTAMLYEAVAKILRGCPATTKLVILDCCHAELGTRANYVFQSSDDIAEAYPVDGLYFIGASRMHQKAKTPIDGELTYFTKAFVDTVLEGIPGRPVALSLGQIFVALRGRLVRGNLPTPVESGNRGAYGYPFARNAAALTSPTSYSSHPQEQDLDEPLRQIPRPAPSDRARAARILAEAERIAQSITDMFGKSLALASVASEMAVTHPDRAGRLIADAELAARAITGHSPATLENDQAASDPHEPKVEALSTWYDGLQATALAGIAAAMAAWNPDRAERLAHSITKEDAKATALANVAEALAASDPPRAERLARSIASEDSEDTVLATVAEALAATDPSRAERLTQSITSEESKASALADVAEAMVVTDPGRAERLAQAITDERLKAWALAILAGKLSASNADRAARLSADAELAAQPIIEEGRKASALAAEEGLDISDPDYLTRVSKAFTDEVNANLALSRIAGSLAPADPDRAERIAQSITDESWKSSTLARIAEAIASTNPDRAAQLIANAEHVAQAITRDGQKAPAQASIAKALAVIDPDRAERLAHSITDSNWNVTALGNLIGPLAAVDPDRAERIAQSITEDGRKTVALETIVEALAPIDPDRAEQVAKSIPIDSRRVYALVDIAKVWDHG
jgi:hypothetical protein